MAEHRLPPPALISPRKPHLQTLPNLRSSVLSLLTFGLCALCLAPRTAFGQEAPTSSLLIEVVDLMQAGSYGKAEERLQQSSPTDPQALRLRLELAQRSGAVDRTEAYAERLLRLHSTGQLRLSGEIGAAAFAAWKLGSWKRANGLFIEAAERNPVPISVYVDWGNLYLEKYNGAEAETIFQDALKSEEESPEWSRWKKDAVYVGLAEALRAQFKGGVAELLESALKLNPENLEIHALKGSMAIVEENWSAVAKWLDQGLEKNANYLPLLELKAVEHHFRGDVELFEQAAERISSINPQSGDLHEILADLSVMKRRLEDAVEFYRESIRRNPRQWSALGSLGINLLRLGREEEGKQVLERAYANDPYSISTVNTLRLLDSFDRFHSFETEHFSVRLHQKEAAALRPYIEELLERSLSTLEQKYRHEISGKYLFEMYPDHEDFAVRTLGLPGLGALGATFGRILAMDSPSARKKGSFHWGSTLWHEMAHVVILSLSANRVPRWFTEGISMMEEKLAGAGWGEYLTQSFVRAYKDGELLPLGELNSGFERPKTRRQLEISYLQAGWVCEFLGSRYGVDKLRELVVAFGEGETTEVTFQKVLGEPMAEIEKLFLEEMEQTLTPLVHSLNRPEAPTPKKEEGSETDPLEDMKTAVEKDPENYFLNLALGEKLHESGDSEGAIPFLEKSVDLFPPYAEKGSAYDLLLQIYEAKEDLPKVEETLSRWWKVAPKFPENALRLAEVLLQRNAIEETIQCLEEVPYVDPLNKELHQMLGDLYLKTDRADVAVREFQVLLNLQPIDSSEAHFQLGRALYQKGDLEAARRQALLSLEIAPSYQKAQKLLLELVRQ